MSALAICLDPGVNSAVALLDARRAAHGFAEGDDSPADLIPVVDRVDDGGTHG